MCELFALSSNTPVKVSFTWRGFRLRGDIHYHGWGIAWYISRRLAGMVKEPRPAPKSPIAALMDNGVRSHLIISHVRLASRGDLSIVNTHPFARRLWGRDWIFAHNGTLRGFIENYADKLEWCHPAGETDSEHAFCYTLEQLRETPNARHNPVEVAKTLSRIAEEIGDYGEFNFLLADGDHLYTYTNMPGKLHYLIRHPPHHGPARLLDEDYEVRLEEIKAPDEKATIIATQPLTDEEWTPITPGVLYVFINGDLQLIAREGEPRLILTRLEQIVLKSIRIAPHSKSVKDIARITGIEPEKVYITIEKLRNKELLKQHSQYPNNYYTNPKLRELIDNQLPH